METLLIFLAGFITGVLVGRNNKAIVEKTVAWAKKIKR